MKLAFHKGTGATGELICYVTHSVYSHVELVFSDGKSFSARAERTPAVDILVPTYFTDGKWEFIDIPAQFDERPVRAWAELQCGRGYDWGADIAFVLPSVRDQRKMLMCSGSCATALQQCGLFLDFVPATVSPGQLFVMATVLREVGAMTSAGQIGLVKAP
jgi:hypothetical protein